MWMTASNLLRRTVQKFYGSARIFQHMLPMPGRGESCSGTSILCSQLPWQADTRSECQWQGAVTARECVDAQSPELARPSLPVGSPPQLKTRQKPPLPNRKPERHHVPGSRRHSAPPLPMRCHAMPFIVAGHGRWLMHHAWIDG